MVSESASFEDKPVDGRPFGKMLHYLPVLMYPRSAGTGQVDA